MLYITDGVRSFLKHSKSKDITLKSKSAWRKMGAEPFVDDSRKKAEVAVGRMEGNDQEIK